MPLFELSNLKEPFSASEDLWSRPNYNAGTLLLVHKFSMSSIADYQYSSTGSLSMALDGAVFMNSKQNAKDCNRRHLARCEISTAATVNTEDGVQKGLRGGPNMIREPCIPRAVLKPVTIILLAGLS